MNREFLKVNMLINWRGWGGEERLIILIIRKKCKWIYVKILFYLG